MVIVMLNIIIQFAIFSLLLKIIGRPQIKKIKEAANIDEAILHKKKLIKKRKSYLYAFITIIVLIQVILAHLAMYHGEVFPTCLQDYKEGMAFSSFFNILFTIILLPIYLDYSNKRNKFIGNVSVDKASDLLASDKSFILYLRGFESDVYNKKKADPKEFSEHILSKVILKGFEMPLCAVGMTKEVECPQGGIRVYVDDANWEEEVLKLMNKAEKIIYRVNDRKSCLWEIKNSADIYHKCVFVVDDLEKYNNVQTQLKGTLDLPEIPASEYEDWPLEYDSRRFYFTSDNKMIPFNAELEDYCQMVGLDADAVSEADIKDSKNKPFYTRPFFIVIMVFAAIRSIVEIIGLINKCYSHH